MTPDSNAAKASVTPLREQREFPGRRIIGHLVGLNGVHGVIASRFDPEGGEYWSIGQLITIRHDDARLVGIVCEINSAQGRWLEADSNDAQVKVELAGAVIENEAGEPRFIRGIHTYPKLGAIAHRIRATDLAAIYACDGRESIELGRLSQNGTIPAAVRVDELIRRHFAVIGSTGVGKTSAVAHMIDKLLAVRDRLRVVIVDPHNEYQARFQGRCIALDAETLDLPFWMFSFDEIVDIIHAGRRPTPLELDALYEVIKAARSKFVASQSPARRLLGQEATGVFGDAPIPFRVIDAIKIIDEWMGKLEQRYPPIELRALRNRLETLSRDPRLRFMFGKTIIEDNMAKIVANMFRLPIAGAPVTVLQLGGLPNEVVNAVVALTARLAFEIALWSGGDVQIALICEEAHRYIPNDPALGFEPTRRAIGRIAKEGRKYGVSLGIVTQRPSDLDTTTLSQCATIFAMRLSSETDKAIIRAALADSSGGIVSFASSIADREAIAFGEAIPTPMRMTFTPVEPAPADRGRAATLAARNTSRDVASLIGRLRGEFGGDPG